MSAAQASIECIVSMVESIDEARERFEQLGFHVLPAGYELGTRSRTNMVAFPDGSALQFVERPSGLRARIRRRRVIAGRGTRNVHRRPRKALTDRAILQCERLYPGPVDMVLRRQSPPPEPQAARPETGDPASGRMQPTAEADGRSVDTTTSAMNQKIPPPSWYTTESEFRSADQEKQRIQLSIPSQLRGTCPLVRPSEDEIPIYETEREQGNEVQGIFRVQIGVTDLEASRLVYDALTGIEGQYHRDPVEERVTYSLDSCRIELVPVDIPLEEGVREVGLRAGFPGHNVMYDTDGTFGLPLHISDLRDVSNYDRNEASTE